MRAWRQQQHSPRHSGQLQGPPALPNRPQHPPTNSLQPTRSNQKPNLNQSNPRPGSLNISYRTAVHLDGKNVPGSYSALIILEVGAAPAFCGGAYLLPQVRAWLVVVCTRSTLLF
jgi:hypothetical protein